ncbi:MULTISPECIES: hypothetical protein [Cupriavidus]|uniref:Uncharacterized protein n=1 Tax=Cupriavidus pauculus TaxID=82633 RepID=A0A3G8H5E0_9BURK|nr:MULTISPECIES: hypothetical protein [Cupriavidus]AZG14742.1 hypothetical protein EHF44_15625 [Cupriavidus pauculus]MDT6962805.1 hypothetical protein [Cupriavidus sp. SZY C1]
MVERESRACWFAAGLLTGAITAGLCALLGSQHARRAGAQGGAEAEAGSTDPRAGTSRPAAASRETDGGADMFEYRGFVVHLFWQALGPERYRAWCDIWEAGAVVQEAGGPPSTFLTAGEARLAAGAWARHWIQNNG